MTVSLVMCSRDDARFTRACAAYGPALAGVEHEVIRIPDARSMSEGYNRAIARARGELVLLSHDDVELLNPGAFVRRLRGHMRMYDVLGVAGTNRLMSPAWIAAGPPHLYGQIVYPEKDPTQFQVTTFSAPARHVGGMHAVDGVLICVRRGVFERVRFDERFDGFHVYDIDFSFASHLAGFQVGVACDLDVLHFSRGSYQDPEWLKAGNAFVAKHEPRLAPLAYPLKWHSTVARVTGKADALRRLAPDHWAPEPPGGTLDEGP